MSGAGEVRRRRGKDDPIRPWPSRSTRFLFRTLWPTVERFANRTEPSLPGIPDGFLPRPAYRRAWSCARDLWVITRQRLSLVIQGRPPFSHAIPVPLAARIRHGKVGAELLRATLHFEPGKGRVTPTAVHTFARDFEREVNFCLALACVPELTGVLARCAGCGHFFARKKTDTGKRRAYCPGGTCFAAWKRSPDGKRDDAKRARAARAAKRERAAARLERLRLRVEHRRVAASRPR
jgi:hypothetical protein